MLDKLSVAVLIWLSIDIHNECLLRQLIRTEIGAFCIEAKW